MLGSSGGERRNAFTAPGRIMEGAGISWSDIGNELEREDGKYTETEMQEFAQLARAEGVEEGIKIGKIRASKGSGNGHLTLPTPMEMADFCYAQRRWLKDDNQRDFIDEMVAA